MFASILLSSWCYPNRNVSSGCVPAKKKKSECSSWSFSYKCVSTCAYTWDLGTTYIRWSLITVNFHGGSSWGNRHEELGAWSWGLYADPWWGSSLPQSCGPAGGGQDAGTEWAGVGGQEGRRACLKLSSGLIPARSEWFKGVLTLVLRRALGMMRTLLVLSLSMLQAAAWEKKAHGHYPDCESPARLFLLITCNAFSTSLRSALPPCFHAQQCGRFWSLYAPLCCANARLFLLRDTPVS